MFGLNQTAALREYFYLYFGNKIVSRWVILALDSIFVCFSFFFAYSLRFNFDSAEIAKYPMYQYMGVVLSVYLICFLIFKPFAGIIRHAGLIDLQRIMYANFLGLFMVFGLYWLSFLNIQLEVLRVPSSILLIHFFVVTFLMSTTRFFIKSFYHIVKRMNIRPTNIIIYGAGYDGMKAKNILEQDHSLNYKVVAFVDEKPSKVGMLMDGLPIYAPGKVDKRLIQVLRAKVLIVAFQEQTSEQRRKILSRFLDFDLQIKNLPPVTQWVNGEFQPDQLQNIKIENLLERDPIRLDHKEVKNQIKGKVVMITGGAGSIGSEIARQVMYYEPEKLILLDTAESALHDLVTSLEQVFKEKSKTIVSSLCDVRVVERLEPLFRHHQPDVIYHAAAYKHVPLMEMHPFEAVQSNVKGTQIMVDLAVKYRVGHFVLVSTDKAVNPTNVMGASKRLAELYCQSYYHQSVTTFITTRFGNVLGSNGSVIPLFKRQIAEGGPLTITHPEVTRYFMTIPEASELVLEAGAMGKGGEIFVFDMGRPIKVVDLARKMLQIWGKTGEIEIQFVGLRPGEKLYEELLSNLEETMETYHPKIRIVKGKAIPTREVRINIDDLISRLEELSDRGIVQRMKAILPEYKSNNSIFEELDIQLETLAS